MPDNTSEFIHVSVAWPYANGDLHVGHLAGASLPADIFARYHRLRGNRVLMVSGSDAHGTPIVVEADKRGISPRNLFTHYHQRFLETQRALGISYDLFTHTDTANHHRVAQDVFRRLLAGGYLYRETQKQLYSESEGRFLPDRFVEGECPICHYPNARGDQCDNCQNLLDALDLINPRSKTDGSTPIIRETEHYFLNLKAFIPQLKAYLTTNKDHWRSHVISVSRNKVDDLLGRPITRDIDWGIAVPVEGFEKKRMYVWFEAVMGYLTASIEWAANQGEPKAWKDWWYNPAARIYNFLGKDNIEFHTIIWQAELLGVSGLYAEGEAINLPYDVPANEFMNIEGQKFSKSRNWAVWLPDILERYDPDAIRYAVAQAMPEAKDSDWSWADFVARNNNELVAAWGNLVNRMLGFARKNFDGVIPTPGALTDDDQAILARAEGAFSIVGDLIGAVKLRAALNEAMAVVREANAYLDKRAPWKRVKEDKADAGTAVYVVLRVIDNLKILLAPFLPFTAERLHTYLGYTEPLFGVGKIVTYTEDGADDHDALIYDPTGATGYWAVSNLQPGVALPEAAALFKKLGTTDAEATAIIEAERARMGQPYGG
ncbi:MAG TPA: methionine--tRNA ligase [Aggregatilineales bacterium]|nr:methionine--tRNA ligase [Aggregatilineales bacterium]